MPESPATRHLWPPNLALPPSKQESSDNKHEIATEIKPKSIDALSNGASTQGAGELPHLKINHIDTEAQTSRAKNELS